ncbi:hypothetical protein GCM10009867_23590 [Pedococcus aerophilus]|uniref:Uncharacterized protein n=1 Tax=Pedococcus aerophilus TaxID=436356 RepID=A0ABP6H6Q8_9MICO
MAGTRTVTDDGITAAEDMPATLTGSGAPRGSAHPQGIRTGAQARAHTSAQNLHTISAAPPRAPPTLEP